MSRRGYGYHSFLNEYIRENRARKMLEIGVASGENARKMVEAALENSSPHRVEYYGFDTFEGKSNSRLEKVREKLSRTGCKFQLYKGNSVQTLSKRVGNLPKMDLIFIDGGHGYKVVRSDWENSKNLLGTNTAVFFHNYGFSGVRTVVDNIDREKFSVEILDPSSDYRTAFVNPRN